jgi:predicted membrane metal-binding protein
MLRTAVGAVILISILFRIVNWKSERESSLSWLLELTSKTGSRGTVSGRLAEQVSGKWILENPRVEYFPGRWESLAVVVEVDERISRRWSGRSIRLRGQFRRAREYRNPGSVGDGLFSLRPLRITFSDRHGTVEPIAGPNFLSLSFYRQKFSDSIETTFGMFPHLRSLENAVWLGDLSGLPENMKLFYREGGLLQILALSGQHVVILTTLLLFFTKNFLKFSFVFRKPKFPPPGFRFFAAVCPLVAAITLYVTGGGAAPIARALVTAFCFSLLRWFRWQWSVLQVVCSATACQIIWRPELVTSPSFFLSCAATGLLCRLLEATGNSARRRWSDYIFFTIAMPFLVLPLGAFFFAKIAWSAPICNLLLAWIWDLLIIPAAMLAMPLAKMLPRLGSTWLFPILEDAWCYFAKIHDQFLPWVNASYVSCIRPTWTEWIVSEGLILSVVLCARLHFSPAQVEINK